jgi:hypothetical protein
MLELHCEAGVPSTVSLDAAEAVQRSGSRYPTTPQIKRRTAAPDSTEHEGFHGVLPDGLAHRL